MNYFTYLILIGFLLFSCNNQIPKTTINDEIVKNISSSTLINTKELKIFSKFESPTHFERQKYPNSFAKWLNNISLKNNNTPVYTFDGKKKSNPNIYVSVLDLKQPNKNVQFNANALLSLRAEYFYQTKRYEQLDEMSKIETQPLAYTTFVNGDFSVKKFHEYLIYYLENSTPNTIRELMKPIPLKEIQLGDVFFQYGNTKSHAVILLDFAQDHHGNKLFILAQGYYPSQDIHILTNPSNDYISPWYEVKSGVLLTPEWRFHTSDLMRFK